MKNFLCALLVVCALQACQPKETIPDTLPMKVAMAYGFDKFDEVNSIAYTWNVQRDSVNVLSRDWKWNIKDNTVYYSGTDTTFTYSLASDSLPDKDSGFVNDKYWFMMPFQLAWDTGYTYETEENIPTPIKGTNSTKLTIRYGSGEAKSPGMGYTPGDAYDLYLDENHKILEWTFRRGNGAEGRTWTWENEEKFGPITLVKDHMGPDGNRFIWFTNISVN
ncbi:hypothetical protein [Algoriphagus winogradskyi]|uniref:Lipoprotein n=1 Tax=Algoriphagus winogradskyi TaxID=237017 RepID=A0ABY1PEL9_9BACT|nr:hypothetical protein [Algoriphagus winogradskyi]SMP31195.1 hypothetical protein SAMN06265367_10744 [Algoriphagus winogradskyi]